VLTFHVTGDLFCKVSVKVTISGDVPTGRFGQR
jgi:hypothetical protein